MIILEKVTPKFLETLLKKWQKGDFSAEDLATLDFSPIELKTFEQQQLSLREMLYQRIQKNLPDLLSQAVSSQNQERALHELRKLFQSAPSNAQYFSLIYFRYFALQRHTVKELAKNIGVSERTLRRYLLKGFELLSVQLKRASEKEISFFSKKKFKSHFPNLAENQAVGIEKVLAKIIGWVKEENSHYAISIEGIGGIGKTLIAKYLSEEVYKNGCFDGYAWISARQVELSPSGEITSINNFVNTLDDVVARLAQQLGQNHLAGLSTQDKFSSSRF
jgi:AraC-like DNA-binding protein